MADKNDDNSLPYGHHTTEFFKQMEILKIADLYKLRALTFAYHNDFDTQSDIHQHHTRNRNDFVLPLYRRTRTQSSIFYQSRILWNNLPANIRNIQSLGSFKNHVKDYFISQY